MIVKVDLDDRGDGACGRQIGSYEGVLTPTERRLTSEAADEPTKPQKQNASQRSASIKKENQLTLCFN